MVAVPIKYFKITEFNGREIYFAARDKKAVIDFYGVTSPYGIPDYSTLREVSESEAIYASYFLAFKQNHYGLCKDGTFMLGYVGSIQTEYDASDDRGKASDFP